MPKAPKAIVGYFLFSCFGTCNFALPRFISLYWSIIHEISLFALVTSSNAIFMMHGEAHNALMPSDFYKLR
ncbi:unnamed protein product [Arabidopsis halleri]